MCKEETIHLRGLCRKAAQRPRLPCAIAGTFLLLVFLAFPLEGRPASIEVKITGVEGEELVNVRAMTTVPEGILHDGQVADQLLGRFIADIPDRVLEALKPFGYYNPEVDASVVTIAESRQVIVSVKPGLPTRVSGIEVNIAGPGAGEEGLQGLVRSFPLHKNNILRQDVYEKAKASLQSRAVELGYLDAEFAQHTLNIWPEENRADVTLLLDTGPRYFFGSITFSGAASYPHTFLRRYVVFSPGEIFSYSKLAETQAALTNSNRFKEVRVSPDKKSAEELRVPIGITVTPSPSQELKVGGGYGTDTGARFTLGYVHLNLLDRGHEFRSDLDLAQRAQSIAGRYVIPAAKNVASLTSLKFALKREDVMTYTTDSISMDVDREWGFGKGSVGSGFVRFLKENSDVGGVRTRSFLVLPGMRFVAQNYDNPLHPNHGYRFEGQMRGTSSLLGSDQTFGQFLAEGGIVQRVWSGFTVLARGQFGVTVQREALSDLPASLRFFAGGDRSVRGYAYKSLGPKDDSGEATGGRHVLVASLEIERAFGRDWGMAAFYDTGNAFNSFSEIRLFQSAGLGCRYYSPVGPIKLDIAYPFDRTGPVIRIHLSIGFAL